MTDSFGLAVTAYAVLLALLLGVVTVGGRARPPVLGVALGLLQGAAVLVAFFDGFALLTDRHDADTATNLGDLLTVLAVLPVTAGAVRGETGRWANAGFAVGCLLLAVVTVRLRQTLGPVRA